MPEHWTDGAIKSCSIEPLRKHTDERGWLAEFFRHNELAETRHPAIGYLSRPRLGIARGPHKHEAQPDLFVYFHGTFHLYPWDARPDSPTAGNRQVLDLGSDAHRNAGDEEGLIINCPNQSYAGEGKTQPVDEIHPRIVQTRLF